MVLQLPQMVRIGGRGNYGQAGMRQRRWRTLRADRRYAWLARGAAALAAVCAGVAVGQTPPKPTDAEVCLAANTSLSLGAALPRVAARLKAGEPLRIVAIGSSSTAGLWVMSRAATYPEVMRRELSRLWPNARVEVVNSGRIGETIRGSIARFDRDVLAYAPDLVVWQLGTNDVARGGRADGLKDRVLAGVGKLKAAAVDVILMDLQYAPLVLASSQHGIMETIIAEVAREEGVGLFPRFELMRRSIDAGLSRRALVAWDGLHNSAAGYDCVGRALARTIAAASR
jgi:acyl-CoA thioesterase I